MDCQEVRLLSDKSLSQAVSHGLINYCPSMDLVALCTEESHVCVYRLNGQLVYENRNANATTKRSIGLRVDCIQWKPNGRLFATAWSDGSVQLISPESSKIVYQFSNDCYHISGVTCMGWSSNQIISAASSHLNLPRHIEKYFQSDEYLGQASDLPDLPRELSLISIETSLPKLSTLPSGGESDEIFCSRSSLDALFNPFDPKDNKAVDVLIFGTKEGKIHIIIYDSFFIGSFDSPAVSDGSSYLVLHAAQQQSSTHALILKPHESENIYFVAMDLRFISAPGGNLSLLASRSTALQNLLRYIHQVQLLLITEWKSSRELPSKFLRNINEKLGEKYQCDIVQALCHSLATGHIFQSVKEWLMDEVSERGHKRWDKAVMTGLENLKRVVHENMLPALERFSIILSRFFGISKFEHNSEETIGFTSQQITLLMESVACLHLISSKILMQVVDEIELFTSFSAWLRYLLDQLASGSNLTDDTNEKESSIDHNKVLLYLQTSMTSSVLTDHFVQSSQPNSEEQENTENSSTKFCGDVLFKTIDQELKKQKQGLPYNRSILSLDFLCGYLSTKAQALFSKIAETEKCNVYFRNEHLVGTAEPNSPMDLILNMKENSKIFPSYFAFVPKGLNHCVRIIRIPISLENGVSTIEDSIDAFTLQLGKGMIIDLKFSDEDSLIVLWKDSESTKVLSLPYKDGETKIKDQGNKNLKRDDNIIKFNFSPYHPSLTPNSVLELLPITNFTNDEVVRNFSNQDLYQFRISSENEDNDEIFFPGRLCVRKNERNFERPLRGKIDGKDDQRLLLLSQDGLRYKVLQYNLQ
ncbi:Anaphase-promoting complex subunit 4 [Golovinomyces cichoracearum]|uniref:Anaphase-promoting complex subunit 4 n=1 Tax=Golovinomyces cichoracearum TaxID=62708 RepID=A0A420J712_9PEZI|nr:Anaphase-promoting complex subunit 4 [Golovinomyces cichoracearum]